MANRRSLEAAQKRLAVAQKRRDKAQATLDATTDEIAGLEQDIDWLSQDPRRSDIKGKTPEDRAQADYAERVTVREEDPSNADEPADSSHDPAGWTPQV